MKLKEAAERIRRASNNAWMNRVNWRFLDDLIQIEYERCKSDKESLTILGGLYISRAKENDPIRTSYLLSSQYINSTHIFTGRRLLGINILSDDKKTLKIASENNAQLWYSQGPSGEVIVFVAPYRSDAGRIEESEIIIGRYQDPAQITAQKIRNHFSIFFKYCSCTAQHSASNLNCYMYRKYLIFRDLRYKSTHRNKIARVVERLLILAFAVAAVWASLYAGGKI